MTSKGIFLALIIISFLGCASYSKREFRKYYTKLDESSLNKINGKFLLYPEKIYGDNYENRHWDSISYANSRQRLTIHSNLYQEIVDESLEDRRAFDFFGVDEEQYYHVLLNLKKRSFLEITVFQGTKQLVDTVITGKLKKGMFYLNNKDLTINGIPFLIGGYESDKRRIGITKDNNLIVNTAIGNEGGVLFIIGAGYKYNTTFEYRRIK